MHFRCSVEPIALKVSKKMDYGNYRDVSEYYGEPHHGPPTMHYAPYAYPPMPPIKVEPIVPHDNDSK